MKDGICENPYEITFLDPIPKSTYKHPLMGAGRSSTQLNQYLICFVQVQLLVNIENGFCHFHLSALRTFPNSKALSNIRDHSQVG